MELRFYCVMRRSMVALFLEIEGRKIGLMSNFYVFFLHNLPFVKFDQKDLRTC